MRLTTSPFFANTRRQIVSGVVLAALCSSAGAAEVAPDTSRVLSDPTYLPAARQFVGVTEYINSRNTGDIEDFTGAKQYSFNARFQTGYQLLAYGITDRLSVGASGVHSTGDTDYRYANGTGKVTSDSDSGITVGATYRALDQKDFPVSLDLSAVVRTGGSPLGVSAAVGYKTAKFTIKGLLGANQFNGGSYTAQPQEVPAWVDSFRRYFVAVQTQTRFADSFSINLSMGYSAPMKSVDASKSGTPYTVKFADAVSTTLAFNYHFIANKFVGKLGYDYTMVGATRDQYVNPALNTTIDRHKASAFFTGLLYAF